MNRISTQRFKELAGITPSGANLRNIAERALESARLPVEASKPNKYGAKKVTTPQGVFDSQIEHRRWLQLEQMQRAGLITGLRRQIPFELVVNGVRIGKFTADHQWTDCKTGQQVTEDVKGVIVRDFTLRVKLVKALYGVDVTVWPERKKAKKRR
jgi:hypothetical protein